MGRTKNRQKIFLDTEIFYSVTLVVYIHTGECGSETKTSHNRQSKSSRPKESSATCQNWLKQLVFIIRLKMARKSKSMHARALVEIRRAKCRSLTSTRVKNLSAKFFGLLPYRTIISKNAVNCALMVGQTARKYQKFRRHL